MQQYSFDKFCCISGCVRWSPGMLYSNSRIVVYLMLIPQDISEKERAALSIVSYIGCGISIICLLIAIIVLAYYRLVSYLHSMYNCIICIHRNTLLKAIHNFIHLNLAIALTLALIVFVSGIETATESEVS